MSTRKRVNIVSLLTELPALLFFRISKIVVTRISQAVRYASQSDLLKISSLFPVPPHPEQWKRRLRVAQWL